MSTLDITINKVAAALRALGYKVEVDANRNLLVDDKELKDPGAGPGVTWVSFGYGGNMPRAYQGQVLIYPPDGDGTDTSVEIYSEADVLQAAKNIHDQIQIRGRMKMSTEQTTIEGRLHNLQDKIKVQAHSAPQPQGAAVAEWYRRSRKEFGEEVTHHHMLYMMAELLLVI